MRGMSTKEVIISLRQLIERFKEKNKNPHMVLLTWRKHVINTKLIRLALSMKDVTRVIFRSLRRHVWRTKFSGETRENLIPVGLQQWSALSSYLFTLATKELTWKSLSRFWVRQFIALPWVRRFIALLSSFMPFNFVS